MESRKFGQHGLPDMYIYLIRIVYIVSVIELIFITPAFDKAFPVRTTFDTVPTWMA